MAKQKPFLKKVFTLEYFLKNKRISAQTLADNSAPKFGKDTASDFIKELKEQGCINKSEKGVYDFNYFFNRHYFKNDHLNAQVIASIVWNVDKNYTKDALKYIFSTVPSRIFSKIILGYTKSFNKQLTPLMEEDKYQFFRKIIGTNTKTEFLVYAIETKERRSFKIVPIELFTFKSSWYICYMDKHNNSIQIVDSKDVVRAEYIDTEKLQIKDNDIELVINDFLLEENSINNEYEVLIRMQPETLNILVENMSIENYEIYEDSAYITKSELEEKYMKFTLSHDTQMFDLEKSFSVKLIQTNEFASQKSIYDNVNIYKDVTFKNISKKYLVKFKTNNLKLKYITSFYQNDIEMIYRSDFLGSDMKYISCPCCSNKIINRG